MLMNNLLLTLLVGVASAANLRNGPKNLGVDLHGFVGSTSKNDPTLHARRKLAMHGIMVRDLADFDWELQPEPDFPTISFEGSNTDKEVRFKYNYTGTTVADVKYFTHTLLQGDCVTAASAAAVAVFDFEDDTIGNKYQVDVNILQDSIVGTPEYTDIDAATAAINFCIRVDYVYKEGTDPPESINFHETNVTITIDLTANFTLTAINVDRITADQVDEEVSLDCEVQAYFCNDANEALTDPLFVQGDIMQVCVEIAESDKTLYHLGDVMEMDLEQAKADLSTDTSTIVDDQWATGLSDKFCRNGICNIRHQLASKFFDERDPNNLDISGIAICAFGPLGTYTRRINRGYKTEYTALQTETDMSGQASVETCKTTCDGLSNCNSFSAVAQGDGTVDCKLYQGDYPKDSDLVESVGSIIYALNDSV